MIGTTTIGKITASTSPVLASICHEAAPFSIDLPHVAFYQVQVAGVDSNPDPISYADLAARGVRLDLIVG